jgi:hypothetical protein
VGTIGPFKVVRLWRKLVLKCYSCDAEFNPGINVTDWQKYKHKELVMKDYCLFFSAKPEKIRRSMKINLCLLLVILTLIAFVLISLMYMLVNSDSLGEHGFLIFSVLLIVCIALAYSSVTNHKKKVSTF